MKLVDQLVATARRSTGENHVYTLHNRMRQDNVDKLDGFAWKGFPITITRELMLNRVLQVSHGSIGDRIIVFKKFVEKIGWVTIDDNLEAQSIAEQILTANLPEEKPEKDSEEKPEEVPEGGEE